MIFYLFHKSISVDGNVEKIMEYSVRISLAFDEITGIESVVPVSVIF